MSTAVDEFGQQLVSLRNSLSVERNSRKLYGYDFVNYRSDCETSNANGLLKYNDVVNFGRRISDASVHNCVMCGDFDVVIPTQNKDVCKGCDSAFWYNAKLNVTFKFCKGCKNFVTLEMFSDKPDASKCCRCRRRGRENYLTKKFIGTQDMCVTPGQGQGTDSPSVVSPALSSDSAAEDTLASFKYGTTGVSTPSACTPASSHTVPMSGSGQSIVPAGRAAPRTYKKRALSADTPGPSDSKVQGGGAMPAKPPKNPRSVSYSSEVPPPRKISPTWPAVQPLPLSLVNTPSGKKLRPVTPATTYVAEGIPFTGIVTGSAGRSVRFARSDSVCSTDGPCPDTEDFSHDQSQYLWNRSAGGPDSPQAHTNITPLHYYVPSSSRTQSSNNLNANANASSIDARLKTEASTFFPYPYPLLGAEGDASSTGSDKENATQSSAMDAISLLRNSCARLFSDAAYADPAEEVAEEVAVVSPAGSEAPDFCRSTSERSSQDLSNDSRDQEGGSYHAATPGSHCKDLRRLHSTDSTFSPPPLPVMQTKTVVDHRFVPNMAAPTSSSSSSSTSCTASSLTSLPFPARAVASVCATPRAVVSGKATQEGARSEIDIEKESPARRQWEWDPSQNPLMHLAMITERI